MNIPKTMPAVQLIKYKHPFVKNTIPVPTINANEVLVAIKGAALNPVDIGIQSGKMRMIMPYKLPITVGNDFAGVIVQIGKNVTKFKVGDKVYGRPNDFKSGTLAQYIAISERGIALMPKNLDFVQAASIPLVSLTSYQALIEYGHLKPGQRVFIQAGSGGVGTIAIQIAKALGAYVATTASGKNSALVKSLGADKVIDYHTEYFADELRNYDIAFDTLGGNFLKDSFKILKAGGHVITLNGLPDYRFGVDHDLGRTRSILFEIASTHLRHLAKKYHVFYRFFIMHPSGSQLATITKFIEEGKVKPIIDKVYSYNQVFTAYDHLQSKHAPGKTVVKINV